MWINDSQLWNYDVKRKSKHSAEREKSSSCVCLQIGQRQNEMLCSNLVQRFKRIVIIALVLVFYATNVLTHSDQIAKNAIDPEKSSNITKKVPFEEYFIEHNVSQGDAKRSFLEVGVKLIEGMW